MTSRGNWQEDDPVMKDHEDGDGERDGDRRGTTLVAEIHEMMIIRNMQVVPCQSIWSIGFIVVSTALTLESLFELSYRIPKLST